MISVLTHSTPSYPRTDHDFGGQPAPAQNSLDLRDARPADAVDSLLKWLDRGGAVAFAFVPVAERLSATLDAMGRERPHIMGSHFDLIHRDGLMKVVDSDLDAESIAWIENRLNEDNTLGHLARLFNQQVVRTYGVNQGRESDDDLTHHGGHNAGLNRTIEYRDLSVTVDGQVRFRSLLNDVRQMDLPFGVDERSRFAHFGNLVEDYILGDITTYGVDAEGSVTTKRTRGSVHLFNGWG